MMNKRAVAFGKPFEGVMDEVMISNTVADACKLSSKRINLLEILLQGATVKKIECRQLMGQNKSMLSIT
jgi:hypothetical protein